MSTRRQNTRSAPATSRDARKNIAREARPPVSGQAEPKTMARVDGVHLLLLLGALALTYVLPFELLVLSYAILGPAHYLTEISWLHDRKYFLPHRGFALLLGITALGAMFIANAFWLGVLVSFAFAACAILARCGANARALLFLAIAAATFALLCHWGVPFGIAWILLPTLIHVSVFTLVFMIMGAWRAGSAAQFALVAIYLVAIALILGMPPSQATVIPELGRISREYFGDVAPALGSVLGMSHLEFDARTAALLSFVYTYHYLNWFIKADVIRWAAVPRSRLAGIALLSIAATGLYFYNYAYGFMVLLLLSLMHVLLEFPLNSISLRQLAGVAGDRFARHAFRRSA